MHGIFTHIWAILGVNVDQNSLHGASGYDNNLVGGFNPSEKY